MTTTSSNVSNQLGLKFESDGGITGVLIFTWDKQHPCDFFFQIGDLIIEKQAKGP